MSNLLIALIGYVLAVLGVIATVTVYVLSRRGKDPSWAIRGINIVRGRESRVADLKILYKELPVESLTVSRVLFWNRGKETIRVGDIAEPIQICASEDILLLNVEVLKATNQAIQFFVSPVQDNKFATLTYQYLDHNNGAVLEAVHTGTSSSGLVIKGKIIGATQIRRRSVRIASVVSIVGWLPFVALGVFLTGWGLFQLLIQHSLGDALGSFLFAGSVLVFMLLDSLHTRRITVPPELNMYREDLLLEGGENTRQ